MDNTLMTLKQLQFQALMDAGFAEKKASALELVLKECENRKLSDKQKTLISELFSKTAVQISTPREEIVNDPIIHILNAKKESDINPEEVANFFLSTMAFKFDERFYDKVQALNDKQIDTLLNGNLIQDGWLYYGRTLDGERASESTLGKVLDMGLTLDEKAIKFLEVDAIKEHFQLQMHLRDFLTKFSTAIDAIKASKLEAWTPLHSKILDAVYSWDREKVFQSLLEKPLNSNAIQFFQDEHSFDMFRQAVSANSDKAADYITNLNKYGALEKSWSQSIWEFAGYTYSEQAEELITPMEYTGESL